MNEDVKSVLRFEELFLTCLYKKKKPKPLNIFLCIADFIIFLHSSLAQAVTEIKRLIELKTSLTALLSPKNF